MERDRGPFPMRWEHVDGRHPFLHILVLFLLLLLVAAAAVVVYRLATRRRPLYAQPLAMSGGPAVDALDIVRLRYARGEIKRDEYLRMSADFGAPAEAADAPPGADAPPASTA